MKNLALIAAVGYNNELGLDNRLLWHIPEDLTFYKKMTMGKNIIMGRNTFESMPVNALKGRNPIVLSSKDIDRYADVICYNNIENLLRMIENSSDDFMVVGGAKVYKEFLPYVDVMYLTELYKEFMKKLGEPMEAERLRKENKMLRQKIKVLKEMIKEGK